MLRKRSGKRKRETEKVLENRNEREKANEKEKEGDDYMSTSRTARPKATQQKSVLECSVWAIYL